MTEQDLGIIQKNILYLYHLKIKRHTADKRRA